MAPLELNEAGLAPCLDAFYAEVRRDPLIGAVFAARIADADRPRHLATIRDVWSSVLFHSGRRIGDSLRTGLLFHPGSTAETAQRSTSTDSPS